MNATLARLLGRTESFPRTESQEALEAARKSYQSARDRLLERLDDDSAADALLTARIRVERDQEQSWTR